MGVWQNSALNNSASKDTDSSVSRDEAKSTYTINSQALDSIQTILSDNSDLDFSVSVVDLQTGKTYQYGDQSSFTAASVGKLITATAFMHMVEQGSASLNDTVGGTTAQTEIQKMLVESDNQAWHNMEQVVTIQRQQTYAQSLGLSSYNANDNTVSSADIAKLLTRICNGKLLDDDHSQLLLSYMQQANYRGFIVAAVPSSVTVYHKVGLLDDRLHDAAILKKGDRSYVLVIFSKSTGQYDFSRGTTLFGAITQVTLPVFFGSV